MSPRLACRALRLAALLLPLLALAGCGGGDEDDAHPDIPTPAVHCAAEPERCR
jgi:hypothetical protein